MKKISKILASVAAIFIMLSNCPKPSAIQPSALPTMSKFTTLQAVYAMCKGKSFDVALESLKKFGMVNKKAADVLNMVLLSPVAVSSDYELNKLLKVCPNIETVQIDGNSYFRPLNLNKWEGLRWTKDNTQEYKNIIIHNFPYSHPYKEEQGQGIFNILKQYRETGKAPEGFNLTPGISEELYPYIVGFSSRFGIDGVENFCNLKECLVVFTRENYDHINKRILNIAKSLKLNKLSVRINAWSTDKSEDNCVKTANQLREIMTNREPPGVFSAKKWSFMDGHRYIEWYIDSKGNEIKRDDVL